MQLTKVLNLLPRRYQLPCRFYYRKLMGKLDAEMSYVLQLVSSNHRVVDVGANGGIYSYFFSKFFNVVEAFEPQLTCACTLLDYAASKNINVHCTALSDVNTVLPLQIPSWNGKIVTERAKLNDAVKATNDEHILVPVCKLDDYLFEDVSLIKIDVEGYESKVIRGAKETILRCKPILIIEIEQRHLGNVPIEKVFEEILALGYSGSFLFQQKMHPISYFSYEMHQKPFLQGSNLTELSKSYRKGYINNFIFEPV